MAQSSPSLRSSPRAGEGAAILNELDQPARITSGSTQTPYNETLSSR
jgi:hypothetical protein